MERFKSGENGKSNYKKPKFDFMPPVFKTKSKVYLNGLDSVSSLPETHKASRYLQKRFVPVEFWPEIFYAEDYKEWGKSIDPDSSESLVSDERLVFPLLDSSERLLGSVGRAFNDNCALRYVQLKVDRQNHRKVWYGEHRLSTAKRVYITEGIIDSLFLPNAVSPCGAGSSAELPHGVSEDNVTLIYDNEPRNKQIVQIYLRTIEGGFPIFIPPTKSFSSKDINDFVIENDGEYEDLKQIIDENTFTGLEAEMKFNHWKKVI